MSKTFPERKCLHPGQRVQLLYGSSRCCTSGQRHRLGRFGKRSIVELQLPIQGAAGKLNKAIAPFAVSASGGFDDLTRVLKEIDKHIGLVVERPHQRERCTKS